MSRAPSRFQKLIAGLEAFYGRPARPTVTDPLEMILFENVAYLADDERRAAAWKTFRKRIGTRPEKILAAPRAEIMEIACAGILPADRVERIREIASIVLHEFGGDLDAVLDEGPAAARKALKRFPSVGDPGAEKILLFSRRQPVLALESNGLRVLLRLGYGKEEKSYSASYRSAQEATRAEWKRGYDWLIAAHQLFRRHGQELCKRTHPLCEACPLKKSCAYFRAYVAKA